MSFQIGTIYEVTVDDTEVPLGARVEFIGGPDDDCFTDGLNIIYYGPDEVRRSSNQWSLETSKTIQQAVAKAMAGFDPEGE